MESHAGMTSSVSYNGRAIIVLLDLIDCQKKAAKLPFPVLYLPGRVDNVRDSLKKYLVVDTPLFFLGLPLRHGATLASNVTSLNLTRNGVQKIHWRIFLKRTYSSDNSCQVWNAATASMQIFNRSGDDDDNVCRTERDVRYVRRSADAVHLHRTQRI